jgi:hypothetical protein
MKKFLIVLLLAIFSLGAIPANADTLPIREKLDNSKPTYKNKYSVVKFFQEHVYYANQTNLEKFLKFYAPEYINNDGFNFEVAKSLFEDLWKQYSGLKYKNNINYVAFYGDYAVVSVTETATATVLNEQKKKGELKSFVDVIYHIRRHGDSWIIVGEDVITEQINIIWGDAKLVATHLEAPQLVEAGEEYSAKLFIAPFRGLIAIGSLSTEKVSYPQKPQKDVFKKFSADCSLERLFSANTENTNEYVIATIGYSTPQMANNNLNMNLSGYACLIRRVNVVPKNKFIKLKDEKDKK